MFVYKTFNCNIDYCKWKFCNFFKKKILFLVSDISILGFDNTIYYYDMPIFSKNPWNEHSNLIVHCSTLNAQRLLLSTHTLVLLPYQPKSIKHPVWWTKNIDNWEKFLLILFRCFRNEPYYVHFGHSMVK